ncbi:AAA family ATPase [Exilibacterium tricleocarpae]|uniref:AAA family ATPase n=2 Tax=Exilibacterium tricleocarpae TaxID=2591008 RepID=A0A545SQN5_9GAMM|nr:AAA family ATPase [Exilibacterium tricleocarpae]
MNTNEYQFSHQATREICRCLNVEDALHACIRFIADYIPVERMYLESWSNRLGVVRAIATATIDKGKAIDRLISVPIEEIDKVIKKVREQGQEDGAFIVNHPAADPVSGQMLRGLGHPTDVSILGTYTVLDGEIIGAVIATVPGQGRYTDQHAKLFKLLKSPFAIAIQNALQFRQVSKLKDLLADDNRYLRHELNKESAATVIGADLGLADVMRASQQVAVHNSPVLLLGETGTGKDLIASHIHQISERNQGPFVKVNCGAIPETLIDSELFGHEKGAFTGALAQQRGRFERANTGTIFLDEIGELPPSAQTRLLRVLQNSEIERIGSDTTLTLDIRVIAATHRNLEAMVRDGRFREDLWYRLNVFPITIPPLRMRTGDIPALVQYFVHKKTKDLKLGIPPPLPPGAMQKLVNYGWRGNVRELENVIERALILGSGKTLVLDRLVDNDNPLNRASARSSKPAPLDDIITAHIYDALRYTGGQIHGAGGAAELLDINASTLRSRMNRLGIDYGRKPGATPTTKVS